MSDLRVPDLNIILIAGRVVREPDIRSTPSKRTVAKFTLAHNRRYRAKDDEYKDETIYVNVVAWDSLADYVQRVIYKGRPILVEGRLRQDEWDDPTTGQRRSRMEIVARSIKPLDWGTNSSSGQEEMSPNRNAVPRPNHYSNQEREASSREAEVPIDDYIPPEDDIPF